MNSIFEAQKDMRTAYCSGAPGVLVSGLTWLIAGLVSWFVTPQSGIITLVIGGMFIFPLSVLLGKAIGCSGKHDKSNPLAPLSLEGTVWMLLSIPIAIGTAFYNPNWFFPAMLLIIAGRYLTFSTLYGMRVYWLLGAILAVASIALLLLSAPAYAAAITGALIECAFSILLFVRHSRSFKTC